VIDEAGKQLLLQISQATVQLSEDVASLSRNFAEQGKAVLDLMVGMTAVMKTLCELNPQFREACNRHLETHRKSFDTSPEPRSPLDELLERFQSLGVDSDSSKKKGGGKPN